MDVYARAMAEKIASMRESSNDTCPSILLGMSLQEKGRGNGTSSDKATDSGALFRTLVNLLGNLYLEAVQTAMAG